MEVNLLGAEEYKTIEGTAYKDQAPVGEKYLVVYLEIKISRSKTSTSITTMLSRIVMGRKFKQLSW